MRLQRSSGVVLLHGVQPAVLSSFFKASCAISPPNISITAINRSRPSCFSSCSSSSPPATSPKIKSSRCVPLHPLSQSIPLKPARSSYPSSAPLNLSPINQPPPLRNPFARQGLPALRFLSASCSHLRPLLCRRGQALVLRREESSGLLF